MARRGKAIFDASMMAGWAIVAGLTVLLALSVVSDPDKDPKGTVGEQASLTPKAVSDRNALSVITSGIDDTDPPTASISNAERSEKQLAFSRKVESNLLKQQNESYNPFQSGDEQQKLLIKLSQQLNELQRRVDGFQTSSKRLKSENAKLRNRVRDLEKMEARLKQTIAANRPVRVVPLPGSTRASDNSSHSLTAQNQAGIDPQATGSIRPTQPIASGTNGFDPFPVERRNGMTLKRQPLDIDLDSGSKEQANVGAGLSARPKPRPMTAAQSRQGQALAPISNIIRTPKQVQTPSRTSFALNIGQFVSLPELRSAWRAIQSSQGQIVGDLRPATSIIQAANNRINLNLLLGPIQNAAEAATLCVQLKSRGYDCSVAPFQGQALVFNR